MNCSVLAVTFSCMKNHLQALPSGSAPHRQNIQHQDGRAQTSRNGVTVTYKRELFESPLLCMAVLYLFRRQPKAFSVLKVACF